MSPSGDRTLFLKNIIMAIKVSLERQFLRGQNQILWRNLQTTVLHRDFLHELLR